MKMRTKLWAAVAVACVTSASAQTLPGLPAANGLTPKSDTIYVNRMTATVTNLNNGNTESLGVGIANGGNIIVGWEDDGSGVTDTEAVWTIYSPTGASITPPTVTTCVAPDTAGTATTKFLSFFRANGSAVGGGQSWGPKIKANLFGDGLGMGAIAWQTDLEVPELAAYDGNNQGDYPLVQLLSNTGQPIKIVGGVSTQFAIRDTGAIRLPDWDYLSNSNLVIVGENRQNQDLVDVFGGTEAHRHLIYRVLDSAGNVVKAESLVSDSAQQTGDAAMWHGVGVTKDGFGVRFQAGDGSIRVRLFDNAGNPTSTNIDIAALTGHPEAAAGGRGDDAGFHGNAKDAYVVVGAVGTNVWLTVLNTNGTVRFSKNVADDIQLGSASQADAAIDAAGNVVVVFGAKYDVANPNNLVLGRVFNAAGTPVGKTFYVSEKELPDPATGAAESPRVAWRGGQVAVVWESMNDAATVDPIALTPLKVVALRLFSTAGPEVAIQRATAGGATTITYTGTLQSSATVSGGYAEVSGATSPYTIPAGTGTRFYRTAQ